MKYSPVYFEDKDHILLALSLRGKEQQVLFERARKARDEVFFQRVEVRSVIEYSNICRQECCYCGMNRLSGLKRYVLDEREVMRNVEALYENGRRVIMFQAGEVDSRIYFDRLHRLLKEIKEYYPGLTVIGSFGNMSAAHFKKLREIGVERYLLKFETSNPGLYKKVKPSDTLKNRLAHIAMARDLGFQVSSGNITGLPGQSFESLADDLLLLKKLNLPMGSTSAFIPNDMSLYRNSSPADINTVLNVMAVLRLMCPSMLISSTSSLELVAKDGQYLGLMAGANVVTAHDGTPAGDENRFVIYKRDRYKPTGALSGLLEKSSLHPFEGSLIRGEAGSSLFGELVIKKRPGNKTAVYFESKRYTYRDLDEMAARFCSFLKKNNINEGDAVALAVFDSIDFIVAFLACVRRGVVVVPLDPQLTLDEWDSILSAQPFQGILATASVSRKLKARGVVKISEDDSSGYFLSLIAQQPFLHDVALPDRNNPALIVYTSGSSGKPKGVVHAAKDLSVDNFPRTVLKMRPRDISFSCSRMHTCFGLENSLLFPFRAGAAVIISRNIPNPFSIRQVLRLKPTLFFAVPSLYGFFLKHKEALEGLWRSVRLFVASGEKLNPRIFEGWEDAFGKKILESFGATELCHSFISNIPGREKSDTCGKMVEGFEVKFAKNGLMFYRGPSLFSGYLGDKTLTRKRLVHGWFKSDDIGFKDADGYIRFKGRDNLVVKISGRWISFLDIENRLNGCDAVEESVVAKKNGSLCFAIVAKKKTEDRAILEKNVRQYCKTHMRPHELPCEIRFIESLTKTKSGKIIRRKLFREERCRA